MLNFYFPSKRKACNIHSHTRKWSKSFWNTAQRQVCLLITTKKLQLYIIKYKIKYDAVISNPWMHTITVYSLTKAKG